MNFLTLSGERLFVLNNISSIYIGKYREDKGRGKRLFVEVSSSQDSEGLVFDQYESDGDINELIFEYLVTLLSEVKKTKDKMVIDLAGVVEDIYEKQNSLKKY